MASESASAPGKESRPALLLGGLAGALLALGILVWWSRGASRSVDAPPSRPPDAETKAPSLATATRQTPSSVSGEPSRPSPDDALPSAPDASMPPSSYAIDGTVRDVVGGPIRDIVIVARATGFTISRGAGAFERVATQTFRSEVDDGGRFRIVVTGTPPRSIDAFEVEGGGWQVLRWHVGDDPRARLISTEIGSTTRVNLLVRRSYRLRGIVTNAAGEPLKRVSIEFEGLTASGAESYITTHRSGTSDDGRFDIGPFPEDPRAGREEVGIPLSLGVITFHGEGHAAIRLLPSSVPPSERDRVVVRVHPGYALEGVVLDPSGRPVAGAVVAVEYGEDWRLRRAVRIDAGGRWKLERLTPGPAVLMVRAFADDLKLRRELVLDTDDRDVRLVLEPIRLSRTSVTTEVLGLHLAEVDDEIRAAYDVPKDVHVVILDPGELPESLGIGRLEKGYGLWMVGPGPVRSIREVVERLLDRTKSEGSTGNHRRVVYTFWDETMSGTNTQHVNVTQEQEAALRSLRDRLPR